MEKVATDLVIHAEDCGLQLFCKNITKGDGSCFFHAVIDQIQRHSDDGLTLSQKCLGLLSTPEPATSLRRSVCNLMETSSHRTIQQIKRKDISIGLTWNLKWTPVPCSWHVWLRLWLRLLLLVKISQVIQALETLNFVGGGSNTFLENFLVRLGTCTCTLWFDFGI